jgi:DNA-binding NtrC family response regulator
LDGDWRVLAKWNQQRQRALKVIVVSKAGDPTLATAAEEGNAFGALFTPFDLEEAESIILRAWSSSQRERSASKVQRKLPSRVGSATEQPRAKHAS